MKKPKATTALVIEQARTLGYKGGFVLIDQAKFDWIQHILKDSKKLMCNLATVASVFSLPALCTPKFNKAYQSQFKRMINWEAVLHYGAVIALMACSVETVENEETKGPFLYYWWPKNKKEFDRVIGQSHRGK
ncbi:MAG: hypothetical protein N2572_01615 [Syntrophales bacterium]|nr:hypothetical protein [Syntrophales bacterium]